MLKKQQAATSRIRIARFLLNVLSKSEDKLTRLGETDARNAACAAASAGAP
jgi:hypothetical protein